jgi:O-antigen ligase
MAAMLVTLVLSFLLWMGAMPEGGEGYAIKGMRNDPTVFKKHITHSVLMAFGVFAFALKAREATRGGTKLLLALVAGLMAFNVLFMVHGRTGQLVLVVLLLYFLVSWIHWRGIVIAAVVGTAGASMLYLAPSSAFHQRVNATIAEITDWQAGKPVTPANKRLETWSNSLALIQERPLLGFGTGGFVAAYAKQIEGTQMGPAGHAENQYLHTAAQLGIVGLVALLGLFSFQWYLAGRLTVQTDTNLARGLVLLMAIGFLFNPFLHDHTEALFYAWLSGLLFAGLKPPAPRA